MKVTKLTRGKVRGSKHERWGSSERDGKGRGNDMDRTKFLRSETMMKE